MNWPTIQYEPPPLYFMHVPKTAGTSWHVILQATYAPQAWTRITIRNFHSYSPADLRRLRAFWSHFGPGLLPYIEQPGMVCITMLREPIEQFVSHLYFRQSQVKLHPERFEAAYLERGRDLFHSDPDLRTLVANSLLLISDNAQTHTLGVVRDFTAKGKTGVTLPTALPEQECRTVTDIPNVAVRAHVQLDRMAVVGITEHFAASTALLCDLLGVPPPQVLPQNNMGVQRASVTQRYRNQLPPDLLEQIVAKTQYDQALYAHACECFAEQYARYRARPRRTYSIAPRLRALSQSVTAVGRPALQRLAKTPLGQHLRNWRRSYRAAQSSR